MPATEFKVRRAGSDAGPLALVTIDNGADHTKPTTFGREALESLARTLDELEVWPVGHFTDLYRADAEARERARGLLEGVRA